MATNTAYKRPRTSRVIAKFPAAFNKGMYYTDYTVPEGFVKSLVNYDANDLGTNLKPRPGRVINNAATIHVTNKRVAGYVDAGLTDQKSNLKHGPAHIANYLYCKDTNNMDANSKLMDTVLSFGRLNNVKNLITPMQPSYNTIPNIDTFDREAYVLDYGDHNTYNVYLETLYQAAWGLLQDKDTNVFNKLRALSLYSTYDPDDIVGTVTARVIKQFKTLGINSLPNGYGKTSYPIHTIMGNELYAFATGAIRTRIVDATPSIYPTVFKPALSKIEVIKVDEEFYFGRNPVVPKDVTITEVMASGYNMLSETPYDFENETGATIVNGILPYASNAADALPIYSPNMGEATFFRCFITYLTGQSYEWKWEYNNNIDDIWRDLTGGFVSIGVPTPTGNYGLTVTPTDAQFILKVTLQRTGQPATAYVGTSLIIDTTGGKDKNNKYASYDLSTAKGMFNYKTLIGVYGVSGAENTIFFSDVSNPSYFPFPNNIDIYDTEILNVIPVNEMLLVITVDGVHLISGGPAMATMMHKKILSNVYISEIDALNVHVLKDQIFININDQFYVLKPNANTSDATDLKNYLNSTPISGLLTNFSTNILEILNDTYRSKLLELSNADTSSHMLTDLTLLGLESCVLNGEVHYALKLSLGINDGNRTQGMVYLDLIYNTTYRTWRVHVHEIDSNNFEDSSFLHYFNKNTKKTYRFNSTVVNTTALEQVLEPSITFAEQSQVIVTELSDTVVSDVVSTSTLIANGGITEVTTAVTFDNYQFIDTGNIALEDITEKRFREVQFTLRNVAKEPLTFYGDVYVDGQNLIKAIQYGVVHVTDPNDPNYGQIYVEPVAITNLDLEVAPTLQGDTSWFEGWDLDLSVFPSISVVNIKLKLYGKGRRASLKLVNTSLKPYEISDMSWVFRTMNAR